MTKYEFYSVKILPDKQIGAHFQTTWELSFVRVGSGISIIGGDEKRFARGDLVLVPPGIQHQWIFDASDTDEQGCIQNISVMFSREFVESVTAAFPELEKSLSAITDSGNTLYTYGGKTGDAIKKLLVDMMGMSYERRAVSMLELLTLLCRVEGRRCVEAEPRLSETEKKTERLKVFCICNFRRNVDCTAAARHLGMNKSALCRFVRHRLGMTFTAYINRLRIEESCKLLKNTDKTAASIAYDCGFSNVTYFNRVFKRMHGMSPLEFRHASGGMRSSGEAVADGCETTVPL